METHMDGPCDICGDVGIADTICTCYVCKISTQHHYCMKIFRRDIPMFWRCEECERSSEMLASQSRLKEDLPKSPTLNSPVTGHKNADISGRVNKISTHSGRSRYYREKWAGKGKTKYIPCQEAIKLSSGSRKIKAPLKNSSHSSPRTSNTIPTRCEKTSVRLKIISPKIISPKIISSKITSPKITSPKIISTKTTSYMVKATPSFGIFGQAKPPIPDAPIAKQSVVLNENFSENKAAKHPRNDDAEIRQPFDAVNNPKKVKFASSETEIELGNASSLPTHGSLGPPLSIYGGNPCENGEPRSSNAEERNQKVTVSVDGGNACKNGEPISFTAEERNQKVTVSVDGGNACKSGVPRSSSAEECNQKVTVSVDGGAAFKNGDSRRSSTEERNQKGTVSIDDGNACKIGEPRSSNAEERNQKVTVKETEYYSQSVPSLYAYWKGSFKLPDGFKHLELNHGFSAHPPSKVRLRIYEFMKNIPEVLHFELVPRYKVLTDLFENYFPDKDDIGVYFFPGDYKSSENHTFLLEFIWTEKLVMRSYVNGVELFVLTSRVLHPESQKWNGNHYLWGVFHPVKTPNNHA